MVFHLSESWWATDLFGGLRISRHFIIQQKTCFRRRVPRWQWSRRPKVRLVPGIQQESYQTILNIYEYNWRMKKSSRNSINRKATTFYKEEKRWRRSRGPLFQQVPWVELDIYETILKTHRISLRCRKIHLDLYKRMSPGLNIEVWSRELWIRAQISR